MPSSVLDQTENELIPPGYSEIHKIKEFLQNIRVKLECYSCKMNVLIP
jgi:hypothetical protein